MTSYWPAPVEAVNATFVSSKQLRCQTPASRFHEVSSVRVTTCHDCRHKSRNESYQLHHSAKIFSYYRPLVVQRVYPLQGHINGKTPVNFVGDFDVQHYPTHCRFGENDAVPAFMYNKNTVRCLSPKQMAEKRVDIYLTVNGQNYHPIYKQFWYRNPITIASLVPSRGSESGGTSIAFNVSGSILSATALQCKFFEA